MPIRAIIIDDERLARNELKKLLQQHPEINIIEEGANVDDGLEKNSALIKEISSAVHSVPVSVG
jgi:two-component system LytT family response regulator